MLVHPCSPICCGKIHLEVFFFIYTDGEVRFVEEKLIQGVIADNEVGNETGGADHTHC